MLTADHSRVMGRGEVDSLHCARKESPVNGNSSGGLRPARWSGEQVPAVYEPCLLALPRRVDSQLGASFACELVNGRAVSPCSWKSRTWAIDPHPSLVDIEPVGEADSSLSRGRGHGVRVARYFVAIAAARCDSTSPGTGAVQ